jgi:hypothetical protein
VRSQGDILAPLATILGISTFATAKAAVDTALIGIKREYFVSFLGRNSNFLLKIIQDENTRT